MKYETAHILINIVTKHIQQSYGVEAIWRLGAEIEIKKKFPELENMTIDEILADICLAIIDEADRILNLEK